MEFRRIKDVEFDEFYGVLEEAFPFLERKTKSELYNDFLVIKNFFPCFILRDGEKVGIISYWEFDDFIFVEHLAIKKNLRNKALGTQFFNIFLNSITKTIVFEVEKLNNIMAKKRIHFYKRLGVVFNEYSYFQPSYHNGDDKVPMYFVSFPNNISLSQFENYTSLIKKYVYKII